MAEDRRVALAALAVTAIIGLAAPIGTVIATNAHDTHRLRNEQAQADRVELRKVLDEAAASLYTTRREIAATYRRVASAPRGGSIAALAPFEAQLDRLAQHLSRMQIRVGPEAAPTKRMVEAFSTVAQIEGDLMRGNAPGLADVVFEGRDQFARRIGRFIEAAHRMAAASPN